MVSANAPAMVLVTRSILRLSKRSATDPAHAPNTKDGTNWSAARRPIAASLSLSSSTSHSCAVIWSHVPSVDSSCPAKYRRKFTDDRAEIDEDFAGPAVTGARTQAT